MVYIDTASSLVAEFSLKKNSDIFDDCIQALMASGNTFLKYECIRVRVNKY